MQIHGEGCGQSCVLENAHGGLEMNVGGEGSGCVAGVRTLEGTRSLGKEA